MILKGYVKKGYKTKELVKKLNKDDIPVIYHEDIDEVAAYSLMEKKVRAVINCKKSITGKYPARGAYCLVNNGIYLFDNLGDGFFKNIKEKDLLKIDNNIIYINGLKYNGMAELINKSKLYEMLTKTNLNFDREFKKFIDNTLDYASKEKDLIFSPMYLPHISTNLNNRHVLIVARGHDYIKDLFTIQNYIKKIKPIIIGVDGGGDALLRFGYIPDIIVGDMDSISDECLRYAKELIVHAYPNGSAPGLKRIKDMGLKAKTLPFVGTSEDIAMIIAYENNAKLIVAVGTHSNVIDFFEKGRPGMASTMLVRLKVGSKLIDAKGINRLFLQ